MQLTVSLVQTNLFWEDKEKNLDMLSKKVMNIEGSPQLVILPEMFSTGFSMKPEQFAETMDGPTVKWMQNLASKKKVILTGSLIIQEDGNYFNRLIWMLPNANYGVYDKRHLFGYAGEDQHYTKGTSRFIASVNGWKVNAQVCYDLRFPVWSRQTPVQAGDQAEYDLLIYVANWPDRRVAAWETLLRARAIENQSYVIGVNRVGEDGNGIYHNGYSMLVDPLGEVLYQKKDEEDVFTTIINKQVVDDTRSRLPFLKDADKFILVND